ncbi:MAG: glutathione S-transferase [Rhizomicrobium sp.]
MKLYWASRSPFVRKVMILAHETGQAERLTLASTAVSMTKANEVLLNDNPLSKIPTLVLDDGRPLYDSRLICEYLDALHGQRKFFPEAGEARWDALRRQALGDGLMDALILWRQERLKTLERQTPELLTAFALKVATALDQLEEQAEALAEAPFDIGSVTLGCMLSYIDFRFADLSWRSDRPLLAAWHEGFESRPSVRATRPDPVVS